MNISLWLLTLSFIFQFNHQNEPLFTKLFDQHPSINSLFLWNIWSKVPKQLFRSASFLHICLVSCSPMLSETGFPSIYRRQLNIVLRHHVLAKIHHNSANNSPHWPFFSTSGSFSSKVSHLKCKHPGYI